jgi:hypothetical protein
MVTAPIGAVVNPHLTTHGRILPHKQVRFDAATQIPHAISSIRARAFGIVPILVKSASDYYIWMFPMHSIAQTFECTMGVPRKYQ